MKGFWGIVSGILLGCLVLAAAFFALRSAEPFQAFQEKPAAGKTGVNSGRITTPAPSSTAKLTGSPAVTAAPSPSTAAGAKPPSVTFDLAVTGVSGSGFTRLVSARVTNTGTESAHNAAIRVEAFSQGSRVKIGGGDYFLQELGTLDAGETLIIEAQLSLNLADGTRVMKQGADLTVTISSDEKTQSREYSYRP